MALVGLKVLMVSVKEKLALSLFMLYVLTEYYLNKFILGRELLMGFQDVAFLPS